MLQIIVVYFAPYYMFRMKMGPGYRFPAVIIAFVINYAAYFAEIYRSGIESIPKGQYEAATLLGYSKQQTFSKWTVRGSTGAWLQQSADFHSHYSAAGN